MTQPTLDHPRFDPEVEELLRTVAADPDSWLLRVPRRQAERAAWIDRCTVSTGTSGLSLAERHLLQAHRAEVAELLRALCHKRVLEGQTSSLYISDADKPSRASERLSDETARERVRQMVIVPTDDAETRDGYRWLELCVASESGSVPSITQLASASLRLEPSDRARMQIGLDQAFCGALDTAQHVLSQARFGATHTSLRVVAAANLGLILDMRHQLEPALRCYEEACSLDPQGPIQLISCLVLALRLDRREEALRFAKLVDQALPGDHPALEWCTASLRRRPDRSRLSIPQVLMQNVRDAAGASSRRILDAV